MRPRVFVALLLAGLLVRLLVLPLPGTADFESFRIWSYHASADGLAAAYGTSTPREPRWLAFHGHEQVLDYPPMAVVELAAVGRAYRTLFPEFPDDVKLTVAIKLLPIAAGAGLVALLLGSSSIGNRADRQRAALAYWLNPAVILYSGVLGYFDPVFALPAIGALVAAAAGGGWSAGALVAIACLTKPQAVLIVPAVAMAVWQRDSGRARRTISAIAGAVIAAAVVVWPLLRAGAMANAMWAVERLATDRRLSADAANLWWVVTYVSQLAHGAAFTQPVQIINAPMYWPLMALTTAVVLTVIIWAMRKTPAASLTALAALGAFVVHAFFVLALQVHENHLFLALPLLAIVAAVWREYRPLLAAVGLIATLNLNFFEGFGNGVGYALPRGVTGIDATVILAVVNCALFVWHGSLFRRACALQSGATA